VTSRSRENCQAGYLALREIYGEVMALLAGGFLFACVVFGLLDVLAGTELSRVRRRLIVAALPTLSATVSSGSAALTPRCPPRAWILAGRSQVQILYRRLEIRRNPIDSPQPKRKRARHAPIEALAA
jgi:hypothetical protein